MTDAVSPTPSETAEPEPKSKKLPAGTTKETARLHRWLQRAIIVCLAGLVIEGTFLVPFLAIWFGWPTLSLHDICNELIKIRYSNETLECIHPYPLSGPPFGDNVEAANIDTARDTWGIQPIPHYGRIGYRDLVRIHDERLARQAAAAGTGAPKP
jgi:hypothetical protein